ncbi:MAG: efflux RND transporter periplasmic adaptor subunit [Planctomycetaceae bacterium]
MRSALLLLLILLAAVSNGCTKNGDAAAPGGGPPAGRPSLVMVEPVISQEVRSQTNVVGTVTARRTSVVASGAEGKVNQFLVRVGDVVAENQDLSILNMVTTDLGIEEAQQVLVEQEQRLEELQNGSRPEEIEAARGRMEAARVTRDIAARKLARSIRLVDMGAINQDDLDDARERSEAADRLFDAAKATFDLVVQGTRREEIAQGKARLEAQKRQVDYLIAEKGKRTTHAPFAGVIVEEHTEAGQWLSKADSVVTLADLLDEVFVIANIEQRNLSNVELGAKVRVEIEAASVHDWEGTIVSLVPRSAWESGSRTFPVKVSIKNRLLTSGDRSFPALTEGMFARVFFEGPPREAVLVHKNCIIRSENGSKVFVALGDTEPKAKPVMIQEGDAFGDYVEVTDGSLSVGDRVVSEGAERLTPFAALSLVEKPKQNSQNPAAGNGDAAANSPSNSEN